MALADPTIDEFLALWNDLPAAARRSIGSPTPDELNELATLWGTLPPVVKRILVAAATLGRYSPIL